jgi:L-lysine exporter family protein LysE/ArgO
MQDSAFITGLALGATLIIAIGAQNAFVLRQGLRREHVLSVVIFCVAADVALVTAGVAGLASVLGEAPMLTHVLTAAGVLFLGGYGIRGLWNALHPRFLYAASGDAHISARAALAQAAAFTFLNPHVYLDTVLLLGSIGARQPPEMRIWFVGGATLASAGWFSALGFGARLLAPLFAHARAWRVLDVLIGVTMLTLAALLARQALV